MKLLLMAVVAFGSFSGLFAQEQRQYATVTLAVPSTGQPTITRDQLVMLVIDKSVISYDATPILAGTVVAFVDSLLANRKAEFIGVYVRSGTKYGEVLDALDLLRQTRAKNIGLNQSELSAGREI